jgi:hypothetical protein
MGPLEMMYGWQALLCACACVGLTQLLKAVLDTSLGVERRKANKWLTNVVLPATAVVVGMLYGAFVPLWPEVLLDYVRTHVEGDVLGMLAKGSWGAACGQFATTLHDRIKGLLQPADGRG